MQQYNQIKGKHPDAILLFRVGDFYETFGQDAIKTSKALGITLTRRANGSASHIELAGFPHHSLDTYLPKLVRAGYRVALCEQLEDPKTTKTIVKRGVTELISPGVTIRSSILDHTHSNYLAALYRNGDRMGAAFVEMSTGEFKIAQGTTEYILRLVHSFAPSEMLISKDQKQEIELGGVQSRRLAELDEWIFGSDYSHDLLLRQFQVNTLLGYGLQGMELAQSAAGACLHYLLESRQGTLPHIVSLQKMGESHSLFMDRNSIGHLELVEKNTEGSTSLIDVLDETRTPMGSRLLRNWLILPLNQPAAIEARWSLVDFFFHDPEWTQQLTSAISQVGDLDRLVARVALLKANPRELWALHKSLQGIHTVYGLIHQKGSSLLHPTLQALTVLSELEHLIHCTLHPDAPMNLSKGNLIAPGRSEELDELKQLAFGSKDFLLGVQKREAETTGISSLKVSFNTVFGYYFEVTHTHRDKVPSDWLRKQTLVNAERYITPELKEYEEKILGAEEKIQTLEVALYRELVSHASSYLLPLQRNAQSIASLDVLTNFALISLKNHYTRPQLTESNILAITEGRHPVIEKCLPVGQKYIANDLTIDPSQQQILMITGPNMAGKSAILRQTALMVVMAQAGCFVPAQKLVMGVVDKLFTRVGASDNLAAGQSTFMVEMLETALILNNLSDRSLILLDEIGRGTSTFDGISIAWSIAEFLHNHPCFRPKTLFATHYHELGEMAVRYQRIKNFSVSVRELDGNVHFLRKLVPGASEHSYGIQVAKMAGIPLAVILRARFLLHELEQGRSPWLPLATAEGHAEEKQSNQGKASLVSKGVLVAAEPVPAYLKTLVSELSQIDLDRVTPLEAMMILARLKELMTKDSGLPQN